MRCDAVSQLLDLTLDHELPEELRRQVDRHLLRCQTCAYELRTLEQTQTLLRDAVPMAEPSPAFRERVEARLFAAFADHLREPVSAVGQWTLPLLTE